LSVAYTVITEPKSGNQSVISDYRRRTAWAKEGLGYAISPNPTFPAKAGKGWSLPDWPKGAASDPHPLEPLGSWKIAPVYFQ